MLPAGQGRALSPPLEDGAQVSGASFSYRDDFGLSSPVTSDLWGYRGLTQPGRAKSGVLWKELCGDSLALQWLGSHTFTAEDPNAIPDEEPSSCKLWSKTKQTKPHGVSPPQT